MHATLESLAADGWSVTRDPELAPRDWAVFLLHTAAEIEHSLLVQYLYAGYSIRADVEPFIRWRSIVLDIAREEMGHLLTLQNVLWLIGGPPNLDRQDFPYRSEFYPFEFRLERLTKDALAKYVVAEMPDPVPPDVLSPAERDGILFAAGAAAGAPINHVGLLYQELVRLFSNSAEIPDAAFRTDRAPYQERAQSWRAFDTETDLENVKVFTVDDRASTVRALQTIGRQGESPDPADMTSSHFERFLGIYRAYGDDIIATLRVATNPSANPKATRPMTPITNGEATPWACLANVRYRELIALLAHVVLRAEPPEPDISKLLRRRLFKVMVDGTGSVAEVAAKLTSFDAAGASGIKAGAPFELPYTLTMPSVEADRWRLYLDLLATENDLARQIGGALDDMVSDNLAWQKTIEDGHLAG